MNITLSTAGVPATLSVSTLSSQAYQILSSRTEQYYPKNLCHWLCFYEANGFVQTYEPLNDQDYCEDCIEQIVAQALKLIEQGELEKPTGFKGLTFEAETCKESENFCFCDNCGEVIRASILWNQQELDHWLSLSRAEWKRALVSASNCYQLMQVLDPVYGAAEDFPIACQKIAHQVIHYGGIALS